MERLGCEVVDAIIKAPLDQLRVHLSEGMNISVMFGMKIKIKESDYLQQWKREKFTVMNSFICLLSIRVCSSRCSDELSLFTDSGQRKETCVAVTDKAKKGRETHPSILTL